jgi:glycine cleavage system transcriptional repressor
VQKLIISAVGQDQPGIVAAFTKILFETGCNIEDTSMTLLEDHFTMLFIVHAPVDVTAESLEARLKNVLQNFHLRLAIYSVEVNREVPEVTGRPWMISVSGKDQTGIVTHVTQYLALQSINIRHLSSKRLARPDGETLFLMALEVDVPESLTDERLHDDLGSLATSERLEIHAEPLEVYTL